MKKHSIAILILFLLFPLRFASAAFDSMIVGQEVTGACNNNNICEANLGEDSNSCLVDCPLPTPTSAPLGGGGGGIFIPDVTPPVIQNLSVAEVESKSAKILWKTNELAACQLFLGNTEEYETESVSEASFYLDHSVSLRNLLPNSAYYFKIVCLDTNRNKSESADEFASLPLPDMIGPVNAGDFKAIAGDSEINLSWQNPEDADFQSVKVFRSETFFPKSPEDGLLVYEGQKTNFTDKHLENDKKYYYTIFAFDFAGNFSSGAAVSDTPRKKTPSSVSPTESISPTASIAPTEIPTETPATSVTPVPTKITPVSTSVITVSPAPISPKTEDIVLQDFIFSQDGVVLIQAGDKIEIDFEKPVFISIGVEKVSEETGAIMLILSRGEETFTYLFKLNAEKTKYETTVKFSEDSAFLLTITVLDKKNNILKVISGQMASKKAGENSEIFSWPGNFFIGFIILLIGLAIWFYVKKRKNEEQVLKK